jgi:hypothetical protein
VTEAAVASFKSVDVRSESNRRVSRPDALGARAWTGRSALSSATSTPRPHIATAGERITRVGAARLAAGRLDRQHAASIRAATSVSEPRRPGRDHASSG